MMDVGRKLYYELTTGNIIVDTGERTGSVRETTQEEDFLMYKALSERVPSTVGCLQLEYGQYSSDFLACSSYRINPETQEIEFTYPDPSEPEQQEPSYQKPLSVEVAELRQADIESKSAIAELTTMLSVLVQH